jgi:hypothetical protein
MTVRREIADPRRKTRAQSPEDPMRTRAVRKGCEERRARWPEARRSSGSAIVTEVFMSNAAKLCALARPVFWPSEFSNLPHQAEFPRLSARDA